MCNTIVTLGSATRAGLLYSVKTVTVSRMKHKILKIIPAEKYSGAEVKCYLHYYSAKQTKRHGYFSVNTFWMFGAEMGANEYGVAIVMRQYLLKKNRLRPVLPEWIWYG